MTHHTLPVIRPLPETFKLTDVFPRLANLPGCLWFDTASPGPFIKQPVDTQPNPHPDSCRLGRYSFLTADPIDRIVAYVGDRSPWETLSTWARSLPPETSPGLPPFQGGIAGLIGYESATWLESIPAAPIDDLPTPAMSLGLYDWTIATDHIKNRSWIISQGIGASDTQDRFARANQRADQVEDWLTGRRRSTDAYDSCDLQSTDINRSHCFETQRNGVWTNIESVSYRKLVQDIVNRIGRGDSFQVNLSQRLLSRATSQSADLYLRLRQCNGAPYGGFYSGLDANKKPFQVLSSSPEGFLQIRGRHIETRPIKGTVSRTGDPVTDLRLAKQLMQSEKDRAENTMIVDLMRNDLSRVCADESVKVSQLCGLEQYEHVQHLVSVVHGDLEPHVNAVDALRACFPGGSVTGAPKIEAMRTIAELEPHRRGAYCGSLGYISCGGDADFNILIRTITATDGYWQIPVGGGVTARSDAAAEETETWAKAEGMLRAIQGE